MGHLKRQRVRDYVCTRLPEDLQVCLDKLKPRLLNGAENGCTVLELKFTNTYHECSPTLADVEEAMPKEIKRMLTMDANKYDYMVHEGIYPTTTKRSSTLCSSLKSRTLASA